MKVRRILLFILVLLVITLPFTACDNNSKNGNDENNVDDGGKKEVEKAITYMKSGKYPEVTMNIKDYGTIKLELYPNKAPQTVYNFIYLANSGFYDGLTFHRIIKGFMIQGGDPEGTGMGGPDYSIKGEFGVNGFKYNDIAHERGVISMARAHAYNSAGSQFFIVHKDSPHLDLHYAAFGKVIEGIEIVDEIASVATDASDYPLTDVVIENIRVETFGDEYPEPDKLK